MFSLQFHYDCSGNTLLRRNIQCQLVTVQFSYINVVAVVVAVVVVVVVLLLLLLLLL